MSFAIPPAAATSSLTVVHSGQIQFIPPPDIPLRATDPEQILRLLEYAGVSYRSPDSEAAHLGVEAFEAGRQFGLQTDREFIAFDWDHVVDNYQIFEELIPLILTKVGLSEGGERRLTSLETARPFMHELVLGMMVGFAIRQNLLNFTEWERYCPQVGLATLTWPDRLGVLSRYIPLISLMQGRFPGLPDSYEKAVTSKAFVHLHHCLGYAERLLSKFRGIGFPGLTRHEQDEAIHYLRRGKAHYAKPFGAMREQWEVGALMLFDDSDEVCRFHLQETMIGLVTAVYVRNPYTRAGKDVGEGDKISMGLTRASRMRNAAQTIARAEAQTEVPSLMNRLLTLEPRGSGRQFMSAASELSPTPAGTILRLHETGTTLGEFRRYYVEPTGQLKREIRELRRIKGGMREIEKRYAEAVAARRKV